MAAAQLALFAGDSDADEPEREPPRKPWACLLKHVFAVDVTVCPACAGAMKWLEVATAPHAIAQMLARDGLRERGPPAATRRPAESVSVPRRRRTAPLGQLELDLGA